MEPALASGLRRLCSSFATLPEFADKTGGLPAIVNVSEEQLGGIQRRHEERTGERFTWGSRC